MNNEKEIKIVNETMLATIIFMATFIVSLSLAYDKREKLKNNKGLFTDSQVRRISIINRTVIVALAIFYFQIDRENIEVSSDNGKDNYLLHLQAFVEMVAIITALIVLYITVKSNNEIINIENPNI